MNKSEIEEYIDEGLDGTYGKELILMNQLMYDVTNRMRWFSKIPQEETYTENFGEITTRDLMFELKSKSKLVTGQVKFNAFKIIGIDGITTMHLMTDEFFMNGMKYDIQSTIYEFLINDIQWKIITQ